MAQYSAVGHVHGEHFLPSLLAVQGPAPRPEETSCAPSPSKTGAWGPETDAHCLRQWEGVGGEARGQPTGRVQAKPWGCTGVSSSRGTSWNSPGDCFPNSSLSWTPFMIVVRSEGHEPLMLSSESIPF